MSATTPILWLKTLDMMLSNYHYQCGMNIPKIFWWTFFYFENFAFTIRFPFDWKNPFGYFIAISFQAIIIGNSIRFMACAVSLPYGGFLYTFSINQDMKNDLRAINGMTNTKESQTADILKKFSEFICTHSDSKQLSEFK